MSIHFYQNVTKKTGGFIPKIDLSKFTVSPHFKMNFTFYNKVSGQEHMGNMHRLKRCILSCSNVRWKYILGSPSQVKVYQFLALPFGLTIAPLIFTKITRTAIGYLHHTDLFRQFPQSGSSVKFGSKYKAGSRTSGKFGSCFTQIRDNSPIEFRISGLPFLNRFNILVNQ